MTVDYTFANFAISSIAGGAGGVGSSLNSTDTSVIVQTGDGSKFGSPSSTAPLFALLGAVTGTHEICKVTAVSTDTLTIVRAQESTIASTWSIGTTVQAVVTAGVLGHALFDDGGLITTNGSGVVTIAGELDVTAGGTNPPLSLFLTSVPVSTQGLFSGRVTGDSAARTGFQVRSDGYGQIIIGNTVTAYHLYGQSNGLNVDGPIVLATGHQETGFCGIQGYSPGAASGIGSPINFKMVMTNAPSSVTLATGSSTNMSSKQVISIDKYGGFLNIVCAATGNAYYYGDYTTVGNCILAVDTAVGTFDHHCNRCGLVRHSLSLADDIRISTPLDSDEPGRYGMAVTACPDCGEEEHLNSGLTSADEQGADVEHAPTTRASQAKLIRQIQAHRALKAHA